MTVLTRWKEKFADRQFRYEFAAALALLIVTMLVFSQFLLYNETRHGMRIDDPLLPLFPPADLSVVTFTLLYGSLITGVIYYMRYPDAFLNGLKTYLFMVLLRFGAMYLAPLEPPQNIIPLADPFVQLFGAGEPLTKDLFFSGHTATMLVLALNAQSRPVFFLFLAGAILVAALVLLQHVHYTVDILAAPVFTWAAWAAAKRSRLPLKEHDTAS